MAESTDNVKSNGTTNVLIVDDHPVMRAGIRYILGSSDDIAVCCEAGNRKEALSLIEECTPSLAIVDLLLNNEDGLELVKECKACHGDLRILVMTMQKGSMYAERVLRAGADGFIEKHEAGTQIIEAIHTVMAGQVYLNKELSSRIINTAILGRKEVVRTPVEGLSDRELHVFQLTGRGLKAREIAENIGLSLKTVETHQRNIRIKLELPCIVALRKAGQQWIDTGSFIRPATHLGAGI